VHGSAGHLAGQDRRDLDQRGAGVPKDRLRPAAGLPVSGFADAPVDVAVQAADTQSDLA
jgi:hypothetical protein